MKPMFALAPMEWEEGRVAVVTGGASGIGLALARGAARRGLRIVLVDNRAEPLAAATEMLRRTGAEVTEVVADVARAADIEKVGATAFGLGAVQLVCSNAGVVTLGRAWVLSEADWDRVMAVNFMATVHLARAFLPRLLNAGTSAQLLVTGSMASVTARAEIAPYVAAKHGLLGLCESLAADLNAVSAHVGVTLLMPGKVSTGMSRSDDPEAVTPQLVAEAGLDGAMRRRRFVLTHPDRLVEVRNRFARIVEDLAAVEEDIVR